MNPGVALVEHLRQHMMSDPQWSIEDEKGFSWWGHRLRQRIEAAQVETSARGVSYSRVRIETDLVSDAPFSARNFKQINRWNREAHLVPLVFTHLGLKFSNVLDVTEENIEDMKPTAMLLAGLQVADAERRTDSLAKALGGKVDASSHPANGPREKPDELVGLIENYFAPRGAGLYPAGWESFDDLLSLPWLHAKAKGSTFAAYVPFAESKRGQPALFHVKCDFHRVLRAGLWVRLFVPVATTSVDATALNLAGSLIGVPKIGAWCSGKQTMFTAFIPAVGVNTACLRLIAETAARRIAEDVVLGALPTRMRWLHRVSAEMGIPMVAADDRIYTQRGTTIRFVNGGHRG